MSNGMTIKPQKQQQQQQHHLARNKAVADALAGAVASLIALWVFYPVEVLKVTAQAALTPTNNKDLYDASKKRRQGIRNLFAGMHVKTVHTASNSFCYFYLYSWILSVYQSRSNHKQQRIHASKRLVLAAVAAMLNTCITLPLDVISTRHQTGHHSKRDDDGENENDLYLVEESSSDEVVADARKRSDDEGVRDEDEKKCDRQSEANGPLEDPVDTLVMKSSRKLRQWSRLWKGLVPALILSFNPSINHTVFDTVKARFLQHKPLGKQQLTMAEAFLLGLIAKFAATISTYPLIQAKVRLMTAATSADSRLLPCLMREYQQNGIKGLYRGCNLQLLHTMLKSALLMMLRERIERMTRRWFMVDQKHKSEH